MQCIPAEQLAFDLHLRRQIIDNMSRSRFPALNELEIEVDLDRVTIRGFVNSFHERQIAISILANMPKVHLIVDHIEVMDQI